MKENGADKGNDANLMPTTRASSATFSLRFSLLLFIQTYLVCKCVH